MNKIDHRKKYFLMLDTETANTFNNERGLDRSSALVYDYGFGAVDMYGNIYEEHSFVTKEVFEDMKDVMQSAYYSNKLPQYYADIESGKRKVATLYEIRKTMCEVIEKYNITAIVCHSASFDYGVCQSTQRYITKSKYRYFFPRGIEIWDTLKMSRQVFGKNENYISFCETNGYMTKHKKPRVRLTAEILYRYLTNDLDFVESHTALEDVQIEAQIFAECMKLPHRYKIEKVLYS